MRKPMNAKKEAQLSPSNPLPAPRDDQSTHGWPALFGFGFACYPLVVLGVCNIFTNLVHQSCVGFCNWFAITACHDSHIQ